MEKWEERLNNYGKNTDDEQLARVKRFAELEAPEHLRSFIRYIAPVTPMLQDLINNVWHGGSLYSNAFGSAAWGTERSGGGYSGTNPGEVKAVHKIFRLSYGLRMEGQYARRPFTGYQYLEFKPECEIEGGIVRNGLKPEIFTKESIRTDGRNIEIYHKDQIQHIIDLDTRYRKQNGWI